MAPHTATKVLATNVREEKNRRGSPQIHNGDSKGKKDTVEGNVGSGQIQVKDIERMKQLDAVLGKIRAEHTCVICLQLMYEPYILECGHTYCYSCIGKWFIPEKRLDADGVPIEDDDEDEEPRKCPHCRHKPRSVPVYNYQVRQTVDMLMEANLLLPADESVEQHKNLRAAELANIKRDEATPEGLFKGFFSKHRERIRRDEFGLPVCPSCGYEHHGGPRCHVCGAMFDDEDLQSFSMDGEDLDNVTIDLDDDLESEMELEINMNHGGGYHPGGRLVRPGGPIRLFHNHHHHHHHAHHYDGADLIDSDSSDVSNSDDEEGSLRDFVEHDEIDLVQDSDDDEEPIRAPGRSNSRPQTRAVPRAISISDDESDEGGAISNRRRNRANTAPRARSPAITLYSDTDASEAGDTPSEAERLRMSGWSPLEQTPMPEYGFGDRLDQGAHIQRYDPRYDSDLDSDDTETMTVNGHSEDDESGRDESSPTPQIMDEYHWRQNHNNPYGDNYVPVDYDLEAERAAYQALGEETDDDESDAGLGNITDVDGDTDMSLPDQHYRSQSVETTSTNAYDGRESSEIEDETPTLRQFLSGHRPSRRGNTASMRSSTDDSRIDSRNESRSESQEVPTSMGDANEIPDFQESSDNDIRPAVRRRPRPRRSEMHYENTHYHQNPRVAQNDRYDPRIGQMLSSHRQSLQVGSRDNPINCVDSDDDDEEVPSFIEPAVSAHRLASRVGRMTSYRNQPARRNDPLRASRSPSTARVQGHSNRVRSARQYRR